jgi:ferritin
MLSKKTEKALNDQINAELHSAYLYLSMAAYFESGNLSGFAHWMTRQASEEQGHAKRIFDYVHERGGRVLLKAIEAPETSWKSPLAAFKAALEHEKYITGRIDDLAALAEKESDRATLSMLKWFIDEQVEEEDAAATIVEQLKMAGESGHALLMMDRALAQRE